MGEKLEFRCVDGVTRESLPIDEAWKRRAKERLAQMGRTQPELARWVGMSQGLVSQILSPSQGIDRSSWAYAISEALGIQLPRQARVELAFAQLEEDNPDLAEAMASAIERAVAPDRK